MVFSMCSFEGTKEKRRRERIILDSSMVEHSAVNRVVVGSSPTRGVRRAGEVPALFLICGKVLACGFS